MVRANLTLFPADLALFSGHLFLIEQNKKDDLYSTYWRYDCKHHYSIYSKSGITSIAHNSSLERSISKLKYALGSSLIELSNYVLRSGIFFRSKFANFWQKTWTISEWKCWNWAVFKISNWTHHFVQFLMGFQMIIKLFKLNKWNSSYRHFKPWVTSLTLTGIEASSGELENCRKLIEIFIYKNFFFQVYIY